MKIIIFKVFVLLFSFNAFAHRSKCNDLVLKCLKSWDKTIDPNTEESSFISILGAIGAPIALSSCCYSIGENCLNHGSTLGLIAGRASVTMALVSGFFLPFRMLYHSIKKVDLPPELPAQVVLLPNQIKVRLAARAA